ncbi:MAG TPA: hypothetical protein VFH22_10045, partial [Rhodocyclaceae bacterium]|nr:hypothetical protein [Rhodocyclaceae bacterium]
MPAPDATPTAAPAARRASRRALVSVFWAMLVGNLLIVAFIYRISAENDRNRAFEELQAIARHQAAAIERWRLDQLDERRNNTDDSEPISAVLRQQATPEQSRRALATLQRQALARGDREVALLAADGTSLLSTVFPAALQPLTHQQLSAIARHGERQMLGVYLDGRGLP